jgi:holo-[acyl-carrier protein] synthase
VIKGIGTDIIEIERIRQSIARHKQCFLDKIYTQIEQEYCLRYKDPAPHFAVRFAAKEAAVKALGTGFRPGVSWLDIAIENQPQGQPQVSVSERLNLAYRYPSFLLSMSHCRAYATATVLLL